MSSNASELGAAIKAALLAGTSEGAPVSPAGVIDGAATTEFCDRVAAAVAGYHPAGASAQRPSAPEVGQVFFDTSLGYPIWYNGSIWVTSGGAAAP